MAHTSEDLAPAAPNDPETLEDFRAKATAFSQLTGVLGGFSMTILVLVLGLLTENKAARDWTVALLLLAATAYIYASGILANSMNVSALARLNSSGRGVGYTQRRVFNHGIGAFHVGNFFLPVAMVITVWNESLWIGLTASVLIALLVARIITVNILSVRIRSQKRKDEYGGLAK